MADHTSGGNYFFHTLKKACLIFRDCTVATAIATTPWIRQWQFIITVKLMFLSKFFSWYIIINQWQWILLFFSCSKWTRRSTKISLLFALIKIHLQITDVSYHLKSCIHQQVPDYFILSLFCLFVCACFCYYSRSRGVTVINAENGFIEQFKFRSRLLKSHLHKWPYYNALIPIFLPHVQVWVKQPSSKKKLLWRTTLNSKPWRTQR